MRRGSEEVVSQEVGGLVPEGGQYGEKREGHLCNLMHRLNWLESYIRFKEIDDVMLMQGKLWGKKCRDLLVLSIESFVMIIFYL